MPVAPQQQFATVTVPEHVGDRGDINALLDAPGGENMTQILMSQRTETEFATGAL